MKPEEALKEFVKVYSPYVAFESDYNYPKHLTGTEYDKYGCLLALHNSINNFDLEHSINVAGTLWGLVESDQEFVQKYALQLFELMKAADCLGQWSESQEVCDKYKENHTFNLVLSIQLPVFDYDDFLGEVMGRQPIYSFKSVFLNASQKRWHLVLLFLIIKLNHYYSLTSYNSIPREYYLSPDLADEVLEVSRSISPKISTVVKLFLDRTANDATNTFAISNLCTEMAVHYGRSNYCDTTAKEAMPNFYLVAEATNKLVARVSHYSKRMFEKEFEVLLAAVVTASETGEGATKESVNMDLGHNLSANHPDYKKLIKHFSGRQKSTAAEREVVLSYLLSQYDANESVTWYQGFLSTGSELVIFSEYELNDILEALKNPDIRTVKYACADSDSVFVINEASDTNGVLVYQFSLTASDRELLFDTLSSHLLSRNLIELEAHQIREINDSHNLSMPIFGIETLPSLLGYREMNSYFVNFPTA